MIALDSARWKDLKHAYGVAADIPQLLRDLEHYPPSGGKAEPWFSLWSALCHQGDVYSASFAAVPHVVRLLAASPSRADFNFFLLPACIEVARVRKSVSVPSDLDGAYHESIRRLPSLVGVAADRDWDEAFLCSALSAVAVAKGYPEVAESIQELTPEVATQFLEWFRNR